MATVCRCPVCYKPLVAERHPDIPELIAVYCVSVACNPLRIENLIAQDLENEERVGEN